MVIAGASPSSFLHTATMLEHHDKLALLACLLRLLQHTSSLKATWTPSIHTSAEVQEARHSFLQDRHISDSRRWDPHARRSRVGQKLSDLTSQRVIVLILAMLIMIPGFNWNSGLYGDYNSNFFGGLSILHDAFLASGNTTGFQQASHFAHAAHVLAFCMAAGRPLFKGSQACTAPSQAQASLPHAIFSQQQLHRH